MVCLVVAAGISSLVTLDRARACSCRGNSGDFIIESGTEFPRNLGGFPWFGPLERRDKEIPPPKQFFRFQEIGSAGARDLPFYLELESPDYLEKVAESWQTPTSIVIIRPRHPLTPGAKYRLTYRPSRTSTDLDALFEPTDLTPKQVEYSIGNDELLIEKNATASLLVGKPARGDLSVSTRKGSCSTVIAAAQKPIELRLPQGVKRWKGALLYSALVDGKQWRPASSLCSGASHGRSWVGPGKEVLYTRCSGGVPADDMASGTHTVEMTAWLPGTPVAFRAQKKIELSCK
jgi:hypothetical protein